MKREAREVKGEDDEVNVQNLKERIMDKIAKSLEQFNVLWCTGEKEGSRMFLYH